MKDSQNCNLFFFTPPPPLNENGRLPVLDLNLRVVNDQFEHEFFEKPCTSETVIPYTSAHSRKMKLSVLVEEGVRRLRNHSRELEWERSRKVMEDWTPEYPRVLDYSTF